MVRIHAGALFMTKKNTIIAAILLLVGVGVAVFANRNDATDKPTASDNSASAGKSASPPSSASPNANTHATRSKPRDPAENPELVSKYGESRTNLSKHVATNVVGLLDDAIGMGEMAINGDFAKAFGGRRGGLQMGLGKLGGDLKLNDDQQDKAAALFADFQKRELEKSKAAVEALKKDPTALMQTLLASDAFSRGKITEAEYKETQAAAAADLKGIKNPLDRKNWGGGKPLNEPTFSRDFQALLEPSQIEIYQAARAVDPSAPVELANAGDLSNLPAMELEKLDDTIVAAKKMTSGLKQMMEGMGGLKDLGNFPGQPGKPSPEGQ